MLVFYCLMIQYVWLWAAVLTALCCGGRLLLSPKQTAASLLHSFGAESRAVVVGAKRSRTVRCRFGVRSQTSSQCQCELHHQGTVRLAQPVAEMHYGRWTTDAEGDAGVQTWHFDGPYGNRGCHHSLLSSLWFTDSREFVSPGKRSETKHIFMFFSEITLSHQSFQDCSYKIKHMG